MEEKMNVFVPKDANTERPAGFPATADGMLTDAERQNRVPVLSVRGLSHSYGSRRVLNNISFDLFSGEIFGFLGPNGSGKTTTIKLVLGLLPIKTGKISICGHLVTDDFEAALASVGGIVENPEMYAYLSGRKNLELYARMYGGIAPERIDEVVSLVGLSERIGDKVSKYSLGMRQRLGIAQALLCSPKLLVLDEPTNGLDPEGIRDLRELLLKISHENGVAVFVSSHQLAELDLMCDRVAVIDRGTLLRTLTIEEIRNPSVRNGGVEVTVTAEPQSLDVLPEGFTGADTESGIIVKLLPEEQIPDFVAALARAGVRITSVIPKRRSLEDAFLEITASYASSLTKPEPSKVQPENAEPVYIPTGAIPQVNENTDGGEGDA